MKCPRHRLAFRSVRARVGVGALGLLLLFSLGSLSACGQSSSSTAPPTTGGLDLSVQGLPSGVDADVSVSGPGNYVHAVTASEVVTGLSPGEYTVASSPVSSGDWDYTPQNSSQTLMVGAGDPRPVGVNYVSALARGSLVVSVSGLPAGTDASVSVAGPDSYMRAVTATDTLRSLLPGRYTVSAAVVNSGGTDYTPYPAQESLDVAAGNEAGSFIAYGQSSGTSLDLTVQGFEISQATQNESASVPLVRDRDAYLRVYGIANEINAADPDIRVDFYIQGQLQQSQVLTRSALSTPTSKAQMDLSSTWNTTVPAALVQPELSLRFEIDPQNQVPEDLESNNRYPLDGSSQAVGVVSLNPLPLRLVPVYQSATGLTGDANASNQGDYVALAEKILPFPSIDVDVRATYTTSVGPLQSNDADGNWTQLLQELLALRNSTDASNRYYYGVVGTDYNSGVAGLGYVPNSKSTGYNVAMGWDKTNSRAGVLAHEVGHNLGRPHSPCGGPANPDPAYPYAGASIGVPGIDPSVPRLFDPDTYTDIMGYCNPQWISDYTYLKIVEFMGAAPKALPSAPSSCILVWGRVHDGELILEPAFLVRARPHLPSSGGAIRVEGRDRDGHGLFALSFDLPTIADHPQPDEGAFAWTVPMTSDAASALYEVEARSATSHSLQRSRSQDVGGTARRLPYSVQRLGPDEVRLEWDASLHPVVLVRDGQSGEVLSFARGGDMRLRSRATELQLQLSDGVRTEVKTSVLR